MLPTSLSRSGLCSAFFLGLALFACGQASAQVNYVPNGGFELDGNNDGKADGWFVHPSNKAQAVEPVMQLVVAADAPEGGAYFQVSKKGGKGALTPLIVISGKPVERLTALGDAPLVFSGKIRARGLDAGGAGCMLQFFAKDAKGASHFAGRLSADGVVGTMDWYPFESTFRLSDYLKKGETLDYIEVGLEVLSNTGTVSFDALSLTPKSP